MADTLKVDFVVYPEHERPFTADATFTQDGNKKPVVLYTHGFKGFKDWGHFNLLADYFARQGFVFIKFNFSHNGTSIDNDSDLHDMEAFGRNNFSIELDDLKAIIDLVHDEEGPLPQNEMNLDRIYLIGHSRGGGSVILKAAEDERVRALATWAAVNNFDQRWDELEKDSWKEEGVQWVTNARTGIRMPLYYQIVEDYLANVERLEIPTVIQKMQQPLLILHGEEDETLPVKMAHDLHTWKPDAELHLLPGADHSFGGQHPYEQHELPTAAKAAADLSIAFFNKHA
ncbi:alpha/beta hydrolase family protein [Pontibacter ramchanderi]|uniref:Alpha/beta hydrolase family protein n=1 Tax=Pontibacter ramchanderi TaxID=1179743 RepID=A0A2N3V3X3_9BACT|nr:alpha/beta fold hydrolase [Pontibacter ramchanderi]PKV76321.1 alpha/beta hydrolase family protein [Pontibacter ramchanderi]